MKKQIEIIVLGPSLKAVGGVANYYSNLDLSSKNNIQYFEINSSVQESALKKLGRLSFNFLKFTKLASSKSIKIVHINPSLDYKSFWRDALFIIIGLIFSKKIIIFFRGWEDSFEEKIKKNYLYKQVFKLTYRKANTYIVLGEIFKKKLLDLGVKNEKTFFIETTVADSTYLNEFNLDQKISAFDSEVKLLFISRIEKEKGIYIAIDAVKIFSLNNPTQKIKLIVAGTGEELDHVKKYVQENKINNIEFVGQIKGEAKGKLLNECHIMLFPTYFGEGLPNSILEGMLYGMPIITRINAGIPDIVKNEVNGFITSSLDPEYFSKYLNTLVLNKHIYTKIAKTNHDIAKDRFTTEKVKERLLTIYTTLNKN